jgi:ribosomal subunit interface protein
MQVQVTGKHIDVGDALRTRITDELSTSIGKYFERGGAADVTVAQDGHEIRVDCHVHLDSGQNLESHGNAGDAHAAFGVALEKIDTRIRRYKRRLKNHHRNAPRDNSADGSGSEIASTYVLRAPDDEADGWDDVRAEESDGHDLPSGVVIAETQAQVKTMTVSMAVLDLDLTQTQTIVFRNAAHGGLSVVYRRTDGNIGWIDPERTKSLNGGGVGGSA